MTDPAQIAKGLSEAQRWAIREAAWAATAAERERCARVAESYSFWQSSSNPACPHTRDWIAAAIRSDEDTC